MDLDPERCYRAALSKDRRFDGRFFTGVVTTGIYCRPVCPVVPPKFKNMRFYVCAAAAEAAGFRPCKRCRPETAPGTPAWAGTSAVVSRGLRLISEGGLDDGDLDSFASRLGIGERQLRRLFTQHLGASPFDVARARRVHFARTLLDQTDLPITQVAHSAGFGSVRQFNHALKETFGEPPTALRARRTRQQRSSSTVGIVVKLPFRPPLAWDAVLGFLSVRAIPGVESVCDGRYRRTIEVGGEAGTIEVSLGGADATSVAALPGANRNGAKGKARGNDAATERVGTQSSKPHHTAHLEMRVELPANANLLSVVESGRRIFDLDADPSAISEHLASKKALAKLVDAVPGLRVPGAWDGFELGVRAILGQQVTVRGATTLAGRIVQAFGKPIAPCEMTCRESNLTHLFPRADVLAGADLSSVGLPRARAAAIRAFADAVASGAVRFDAGLGLGEAVAQLCAIPGLGPWTAHYVAMRALGEPDAFPETDLGLRRALGSSETLASVASVREQAEAWRPWRSYAAMYLWSALTPKSESKETNG